MNVSLILIVTLTDFNSALLVPDTYPVAQEEMPPLPPPPPTHKQPSHQGCEVGPRNIVQATILRIEPTSDYMLIQKKNIS